MSPAAQVGQSPNLAVKAGFTILFFAVPLSISGMQVGLGIALAGGLWSSFRSRRFPATALDLPLLLFLGLTLLSAALSGDPARGLQQFLGSWIIASFYLATGFLGDEGFRRLLFRVLFWTAAAVAVYGIGQHLTGLDVIRPDSPLQSLEIGGRTVFFPRGAFNHYQTFANVFFLLFSVSFAQAVHNRARGERIMYVIVAFCTGAVLVLTYTRGIWISSLIAVLFIVSFSGKRALAALGSAAAVVGVIFLLSFAGMSSRAESIFETDENVERLLLWETTWNMIRDYPLLGVGVGNYQRVQTEYLREGLPFEVTRSHSHNNLLQVTVERGVFGLLIFLWLWYLILKKGLCTLFRLRQPGGRHFALVLGCLAGAIGFFVDGMFQNNFGDTEVAILFWLMVGVVFLPEERRDERLSPSCGEVQLR
jgi:O-antigen ligase